jgi:hypothetical protein
MNIEQVKRGEALMRKIDDMQWIERALSTEGTVEIYLHLNDGRVMTIYDIDEHPVFEKMIEAGKYAAMAIRAMAENDLEAL